VLSLTQDSASVQLQGSDLLSRISTEMVRAQKKFFGKGPTSTKTYMLDDFVMIVMRGSRTVAEATMLEFGQHDLVRNFRQQFENEMTARLVGMIEDLTGREVRGYQSQILFDPDVVIEIFFFVDGDGVQGDAAASSHVVVQGEWEAS
jgi:uncharacterized protein YbcI